MKQSGLWSDLGRCSSLVAKCVFTLVVVCLLWWTKQPYCEIGLSSRPWRSRSISPKTIIRILTKVFFILCPNLVIPAGMVTSFHSDKLGVDTHIRRHTHTQTQATTIAKGQNWPWVKLNGLTHLSSRVSYSFCRCLSCAVGWALSVDATEASKSLARSWLVVNSWRSCSNWSSFSHS